MNTSEIRDALQSGTMTPEQAREAFIALRQQNQGASQSRTELTPASRNEALPARRIDNLPTAGKLNIGELQAKDREALKAVRSDLALAIENRSTRHEYQRQYVEESARHALALPMVGLLGIADGALEGIGYGISEIAETFTYTLTRTMRRIKEGFERGRHQ